MKQKVKSFVAVMVALSMLTLNCPLMASELTQAVSNTNTEVTTKIVYSPGEAAIAGQRIPIQVEVMDEKGIDVVRIYFRAMDSKEYSYVTLNESDKSVDTTTKILRYATLSGVGGIFTGILPAPANGAGEIDYLFLAKNKDNQIVKSQNYQMTVNDSDNADPKSIAANSEKIQVYTELLEAPSTLSGFMDNITIHVVKSSVKYGVTAGIYSAAKAGSSTSAAASTGTVAATTTGITTTSAVVAGVATTALVVVGAAAVSSGGSGGGGGEEITSQSILGTWNVSENGSSFTLTFLANGRYFIRSGTTPGSWSLSGTKLTIRPDHGGTWTGTVAGDSKAFTMSGNTVAKFSR